MKGKELYEYRKQNHLCKTCGEKLPDKCTYVTCEKCRAYRRHCYSAKKKGGVCVSCGEEDAYTMNGRSECAECNAARMERYRERWARSAEMREKSKQAHALRYNERKEQHRCTQCGKPLSVTRSTQVCKRCRIMFSNAQKKSLHKRGGISRDEAQYYNLCYMCLKKEPLSGRKMCEECYKKIVENSIKGRAAVDTKNHIWRRLEAQRYCEVRERYGRQEKPTSQE